jgi:hypothetical protein
MCEAAIGTFEVVRSQFEAKVSEGRLDTTMFTTYANALSAFLQGMGRFDQAITDTINGQLKKRAKR